MKAPLSWLKEYVDIDCTAEELESKLFSCGFEVEGMEHFAANVKNVVVCKILEMNKHPNADKLSVTKVDAGKYGVLQIITAAKNVFVGAVVPVALDGATLYDGTEIKKGELRGLPSCGMFCGGEELGINSDYYKGAVEDGVLIFDKEYPLGSDVKEILELNDVMFDINVTANRPDCQSILGLAREIAAVLDKPVKEPNFDYKTNASVSTEKTIKVTDDATDLCPRYISHFVKDVKLSESPEWMKRRLFKMGIRSINNIVDITNYVLLEIGQPMHAFDLSDLEKNEIIIRRANVGEKITTLDEKTFSLSENNLVICDGVKPVALAGIMGGLNSGIKNSTKNIVFEAAEFLRDNVRKTSRSLGQRSDSSSRFEKGVDAYTAEAGMKRALHLVDELNCGTIASDEYDLCYEDLSEKVIKTTLTKVNGVLGITVPAETVKGILERLSFKVSVSGDDLTVTVPRYREDMESYPDIAEEIIREYGYDHIKPTLLKTSSITNGGRNDAQKEIENLKNLLVGYGFNEIVTYSFVSEKEYDTFGIEKDTDENKLIRIMNPLGEDVSVMRTSLLPSIVRTVCYNLNRKNFEGRLFEFARTYRTNKTPLEKLPIENNVLSFAVFGENEDFFTAKGVAEGILNTFCNGSKVRYERSPRSAMHPTRSAEIIVDGETVGYFGEINPVVAQKLDADKKIYAGEIFYDVLKKHFRSKIVFKQISKFPTVERDLAIVLNNDVTWQQLEDCIKESAGDKLENIKLFDVYRADVLGLGKKSMAFNLLFSSCEKTLTVEEIDSAIKNILKNIREKLGGVIR